MTIEELADLMRDSGLTPTQSALNGKAVEQYAQWMRSGQWDWNKTATEPMNRMIIDPQNNIMAGHHRFVAARLAGVKIPEAVVLKYALPTVRTPGKWEEMQVR